MLVGLNNVTFEFGARIIVSEATWHIQPGERIGLIGYNGTGKSTLLKVIVGDYQPSVGTVERGRNVSIGYLHQDLLSFDTGDNITEVAMGAFERIRSLEKEIEQLGAELEKTGDEKTLEKYMEALHEMEVLDGYNITHKTEEVLHGLGFSNADLTKPYKEFSGGWRMRVLLAKMILQQPDVLLLDEPTNHLDLPSIEWLEKYLLAYKGAVVIVSHDKFFLNRMVNKIVELYQQRLHIYTGDYEFYEAEKAIRIDLQQKAFENQQDYIRQQERFIERFKAKASKAAAAQSAMKRLDKIDRIEDVQMERPDLRINFSVGVQPGKVLVNLKGIHKQFGTHVILHEAEAEIERGDKIAFIGANGKGKSTGLRIIAGSEAFSGERIWGHNVNESFYAQHQLEALNLNNTLLDEMKECGSGKNELELRSLLGCFLFSGDDHDKKIKVLSGGEKARVALAKVIASKANFLMLDEPTNHLDMHSVELLAQALNRYEGTIILVSHDRYFISKTANKIWEIEDGKIKEFKGGYDEWVAWKERMEKQARLEKKEAALPVAKPAAAPAEQKPKVPVNRDQQRLQQQLQKDLEKAEKSVERIQQQIKSAEEMMADPVIYSNQAKYRETEQTYQRLKSELKAANQQYEKLFEEVMSVS